ncbi:MAG: hypothetical protein PHQ96_03490 [Candidatus Omnitrophica bacterium]|nr:hypothetical protein [Candidatus Omnitrophota bacterium]
MAFLLACAQVWPVFAQQCIAIDLNNRKVELADFSFGKLNIKGDFLFDVVRENGSLVLNLEGKDILVKEKKLPWLKLKIVKRGDKLFINNFSSPEFIVRGNFNLADQALFLDINVNTSQNSPTLAGHINARAKIWGHLNNCLASGSINVADGNYQGVEFLRLAVNFLGKPPLLNLTDSEVTLKDGSIFKIEGLLSLKDFNNLFPKAEFISQKVILGDWQLLAQENKNVGFKKEIDDKFDIVFDAYDQQDEQALDAGTELRYKMHGDKFLKLRMEEDKSIFGIERRKEF